MSDDPVARIARARTDVLRELRKAVIGQERVVEDVLAALFAGGHCLLTGVPGLAKTLLVSSLGQALSLSFRRVQFTPDLMPSDLIGSEVLELDRTTGRRALAFRPGPVFTHLLLADEINRTPPKTQAALVEAMQERQVTAGGQTRPLAAPFFVLATQNPIEQEGTYPLPAVQQDRFLFSLILDYLPRDQEAAVVRATTGETRATPVACLDGAELLACQAMVRELPVAEPILAYAAALAAASRPGRRDAPAFVKEYVAGGASLRGAQALVLGAKARALLAGRPHVSPADVRSVAHAALRHRIRANFHAESAGVKPDALVDRLLETVKPPASGL